MQGYRIYLIDKIQNIKESNEKLLYKVGFFFFEKFDYNFYYTFLNTGINIGLASSIEEY